MKCRSKKSSKTF